MKFNIKHDAKNQKFFTLIGGKECALKYNKVNDTLLDFKLMFVPQNLRGQGLASRITEFGIMFAKKNGMKIKTTCSYVAEYVQRHKDKDMIEFRREEATTPVAV